LWNWDGRVFANETQCCDFAFGLHVRCDWQGCAEDEAASAAVNGVQLVEGSFGKEGDIRSFFVKIEVPHNESLDEVDGWLLCPVRLAAEEVFFPLETRLLNVAQWN
jgi:hypothetical protein